MKLLVLSEKNKGNANIEILFLSKNCYHVCATVLSCKNSSLIYICNNNSF